jgi:5'-nucleotidase
MKILLSNDDGVFAKGLATLYAALSKNHQVTVIAPDRNCSASSNALSIQTPLRVQHMENGFLAVNGTPSDCVHLGINKLLAQQPDLVVSGISHGANLGDDIIYSGTVAAATEGRHMGLPAIAVSLASKSQQNFDTAAQVVVEIVDKLAQHPLPANQILNINVPDVAPSELKGLKVTRQGKRHKAENMTKAFDPHGKEIYWYGDVGPELDASEGTDFFAITHGYASITPLSIDMTAHNSLVTLASWITKDNHK